MAYSPLGRGQLTGRLIEAVATAQSCTPGQIALAWVIGGGEHILALTGTTKLENLKANLGACDVELSNNERMNLDELAARVMGDRYDTWGMAGING